MSEPSFEDVRRIFEAALDLPASERAAFVASEADGDEALVAQVSAMLATDDDDGDFLESLATGTLEKLLGDRGGDDMAGTKLGAFAVERLLGRGGMGAVYLARQDSPNRLVALKVLEGFPSRAARRRFEYEAELLASLRHPGIAQVYEVGAFESGAKGAVGSIGLPYFAMEYVEDARTLLDFASAEALDLRRTLALFLDVCDAVQHGHSKGILHRDLKPANLLVDRDGRAKVIDFGIARATQGEEDARTQLTRTGELVGTLGYMAPERLGASADDAAASGGDTAGDVYSLGIVLYELLAKRRAFDLANRSLPEAIRVVAEESPTPLHRVDPSLARDLSWITLRASEKEPARRYPTVSALADDLRRFLSHEPVDAGPPSAVYRARKFVRRHRTGVVAAAIVALVSVFSVIRVAQSRAAELAQQERARATSVRALKLKDSTLLDELTAEAEELYPPLPDMVAKYDAWLARANVLETNQADTLATLEELHRTDGDDAEDELNAFLASSLQDLIDDLGAFTDPETGLIADVEERLAFARTIRERSVDGTQARDAWRDAIAYAASADAPYDGLPLTPQVGLLPIGRDPASGLLEFAHLRSGTPALRDEAGRVALDEETGIVLVLVPGGRAWMGADLPSDARPEGSPYVDPLAIPIDGDSAEGPALELELDAYLLSKYEVTQAQWMRMTKSAPSRYPGALRPVESIDWATTVDALRRVDLVLPSEAQWERAARAGTSTPWWMGDEPEDWSVVARLLETQHAVVGSYPPNPFGFHDMLGNVMEWCADPASKWYRGAVFERGTGLRATGQVDRRARRGGFCQVAPEFARIASRASMRFSYGETTSDEYAGVRPARALRP